MQWEGETGDGSRPATPVSGGEIDQRYFRPAEVDTLLGDQQSAREVGWTPTTT